MFKDSFKLIKIAPKYPTKPWVNTPEADGLIYE